MEKCWILNRGRKQDISEGPFLNAVGNLNAYKLMDTVVLSCTWNT